MKSKQVPNLHNPSKFFPSWFKHVWSQWLKNLVATIAPSPELESEPSGTRGASTTRTPIMEAAWQHSKSNLQICTEQPDMVNGALVACKWLGLEELVGIGAAIAAKVADGASWALLVAPLQPPVRKWLAWKLLLLGSSSCAHLTNWCDTDVEKGCV